jgi:hypothetical protein
MKEQYKTKVKCNMSEQLEFKFQINLFENIYSIITLKEAFKLVKKNKGAPGIDEITIEEYEENLEKKYLRFIFNALKVHFYQ